MPIHRYQRLNASYDQAQTRSGGPGHGFLSCFFSFASCFKKATTAGQPSRSESRLKVRQLRTRLSEFVNSKRQPRGYSLMIRYLMHWQLSVYSMVWIDMLLWVGLYTAVNIVYRRLLNPGQQRLFANLVHSVDAWQSNVPVTFILGFYVSAVVHRWWQAYLDIPTMSAAALRIESTVFNHRDPDKAEKIRLTLARYLNLAWLLHMWKISEKIKQRFRILRDLIGETNRCSNTAELSSLPYPVLKRVRPQQELQEQQEQQEQQQQQPNLQFPDSGVATSSNSSSHVERHRMVELLVQDLALWNQDPAVIDNFGEIITPSEIAVYEDRAAETNGVYAIEYELPLHWAAAVAKQANSEGFVRGHEGYEALVRLLCDWSSMLCLISKYANRKLPLVYTQVVIIAVYTWYFTEVVASQNLVEYKHEQRQIVDARSTNSVTVAAGRSAGHPADEPLNLHHSSGMRYWADFYVPVLALLKLLFVLGWFKVAQLLMDPYDDDLDGLPFSDVLNSNLRRGRVMAGFSARHLLPRKLQLRVPAVRTKTNTASNGVEDKDLKNCSGSGSGDYLHSDEEWTQELRQRQAGPWTRGESSVPQAGNGGDNARGTDRVDACRRCANADEGLLPQEGDLP